MKPKIGIRTKLLAVIFISILISSAFNETRYLKEYIASYRQRVEENAFLNLERLKIILKDTISLGLKLGELTGVNQECEDIVSKVKYSRYCMVMGVDRKIYYHNDSRMVGVISTDAVIQNILSSQKRIIQKFEFQPASFVYDFAEPLTDLDGKIVGFIRLGISSEVIDAEVKRFIKNAVISAVFTLLIIFIVLAFFIQLILIKPLKKLMWAISEFGRGKFDTHVQIDTQDEIGILGRSFNKMVQNLKRTTTSIANLHTEIEERKKIEEELQEKLRQLKIFQKVAVGRELKMVELKEEIALLKQRLESNSTEQK